MNDPLKDRFLGQPRTPDELRAMIEQAVLAEREACAKVCDARASVLGNYEDETKAARSCAEAIRNRSP